MKARRSFLTSGITHPKTGLHDQEELNLLTAMFRRGMGGFHRADVEDSGLPGCYTVQHS